jgi:hypothetical protein
MNAEMRAVMVTERTTTIQSWSGPRDAGDESPTAEKKTTLT